MKKLHSHYIKLTFNLDHVRILGSMEYVNNRNDFSGIMHKINIKQKKDYAEKVRGKNGIEIQSQYWGVNRSLSMEGIAVEYSPK